MTKAGFWKTDWFLGVAVVISVVLFNRLSDLVPSLECKAYDLGVVATSRASAVFVSDKMRIDSLSLPASSLCPDTCESKSIWR